FGGTRDGRGPVGEVGLEAHEEGRARGQEGRGGLAQGCRARAPEGGGAREGAASQEGRGREGAGGPEGRAGREEGAAGKEDRTPHEEGGGRDGEEAGRGAEEGGGHGRAEQAREGARSGGEEGRPGQGEAGPAVEEDRDLLPVGLRGDPEPTRALAQDDRAPPGEAGRGEAAAAPPGRRARGRGRGARA